MSANYEELKQKLGSAIAHGTYLNEEARESLFYEILQGFENISIQSRLSELKLLREDYDISMDFEPIDKRIAELENQLKETK